MISKAEIAYELEIEENTDIDSICESFADHIILWVTASGRSAEGEDGYYRCLLQYSDNTRYVEGAVPDATAYQAMIHGAKKCVERIRKSSKIAIISATALGFENAFRGKGPNADLFQQLFEEIKNKDCSLTEVRFINGADVIKTYVYEKSGDQDLIKSKQEEQARKNEYISDYKQNVYKECIQKVVAVLEENKVSEDIIARIRTISDR